MSTSFQALGNAEISLITSFVRQIIVLLPLAYILSVSNGLTGVWIAFPMSEIVTLIISVCFGMKIYSDRIQVLHN